MARLRTHQHRFSQQDSRDIGRMLDARCPDLLALSGAPGLSVVVSIGGERISRVFGWADILQKLPITKRTAFRVASLSKPVTALGIMHLHEASRVDLDEPIDRYLHSLPFRAQERQAARHITLRQILSHTSGLGVHHYGTLPAMDPEPSTMAVLSGVCGEGTRLGIVAPPGTVTQYSGGAYTLAQLVVEEVTGMPFAAFMQRAVFEPLGMRDSGYGSRTESLATGYTRERTAIRRSFLPAASSGLSTTPTDLVRLWEVFLSESTELAGKGIITPEGAKEMLCLHATEPNGPAFGMGFCIGSNRLGETFQHAGWTDGEWAFAMGNAQHGIALALATNSVTGCDWGKDLAREIVGVLSC